MYPRGAPRIAVGRGEGIESLGARSRLALAPNRPSLSAFEGDRGAEISGGTPPDCSQRRWGKRNPRGGQNFRNRYSDCTQWIPGKKDRPRPISRGSAVKRLCIMYGRNCSDGGIAVPGKSRCRAHGGGAWARVSPVSRGRYGADWQLRRARVLREQPNCECGRPATDVHHVVAAADGGSDDRSNLRAVCNPCHRRLTAEQNRARRKRRREH